MFVLYGEQYAQILERFGEACGMEAADVQAEAAAVRAAIGEVREATLTAGWDGAWFRRAYDQLRLRQSFQSARPMSGRPCGPRCVIVKCTERRRCSSSGCSEPS